MNVHVMHALKIICTWDAALYIVVVFFALVTTAYRELHNVTVVTKMH